MFCMTNPLGRTDLARLPRDSGGAFGVYGHLVYASSGSSAARMPGRALAHRILLLSGPGNILYFRSEAGRTVSGREPTFLLPPVAVHAGLERVGESPRDFGKNPGRRRTGGSFGRSRNC